jgi:hypothetical protein
MEDEWPGEYTPISPAGRRSSFGDTVEVLRTDYLEIGGDPIRPTILNGLNLKITPTVWT